MSSAANNVPLLGAWALWLVLPISWGSVLYGQSVPEQPPLPADDRLTDDRVACPSQEQLDRWFRGVDSLRAEISTGDRRLPRDCSERLFRQGGSGAVARHEEVTTLWWVAPELWHQPLYFDDVPLENYGQTKHPRFQPAISAGRFFLSVPAIPYKMAVDRPFSLVTTLGTYRPGSPAPCVLQVPPWDRRAAVAEGLTIAGLILLLP